MNTPMNFDIYSPDVYVESPPHEIFEELRQNCPVYYQEIPGEAGYFAVLRHADIVAVSREPNLFSASEGGVVLEDLDPIRLAHMRNMLLAMDPPRHTNWRRSIAPKFKSRAIGKMEDQIRRITKSILSKAEAELDFVHDVCSYLPSNVMGEIMGIPAVDRSEIHKWAERQAGGQDPELNPEMEDYGGSSADASMEMYSYAVEHAKKHRQNPVEGLTSQILSVEVDGHTMTDEDFGSFFVQLVTAGNDTTRTMLASGTLALLEHPEQLAEVRSNPALIPSAVEEILRWANPLHYFRRTATKDTELAGVKIEAGQKVAMIYTSGNRDSAVFDNPHAFDIHRNPNPHLSFGIGEHFCLGVHLARLEGRIFFEELFNEFSEIELCGEPRRTRSNLNNSLKELPIKLTRQ